MFVVLTESARTAEPGERTFDHPTPGQDFETVGGGDVLDDLQARAASRAQGASPLDERARVASVGPDAAQPTETSPQGREQQTSAVAILEVGRVHADQQNQSQRIDQKMSLSSCHLLASIVATNSALLSCAHTLRVEDRSRGGFFLPAWTRTASRKASFSRAHTPCFFQWAK